jgi:hypothetical protein
MPAVPGGLGLSIGLRGVEVEFLAGRSLDNTSWHDPLILRGLGRSLARRGTSIALVGDCLLNLSRPSFDNRDSIFSLRHGTYPEHHRAWRRVLLSIKKTP